MLSHDALIRMGLGNVLALMFATSTRGYRDRRACPLSDDDLDFIKIRQTTPADRRVSTNTTRPEIFPAPDLREVNAARFDRAQDSCGFWRWRKRRRALAQPGQEFNQAKKCRLGARRE